MNDESGEEGLNYGFELSALVLIIAFMIFFGGVTQPKLSIDTVLNRALNDYQSQTEEIVIEKAPPRTENLKGFEPLKD